MLILGNRILLYNGIRYIAHVTLGSNFRFQCYIDHRQCYTAYIVLSQFLFVTIYMCFQNVDYSRLQPVRYARLKHNITGLCVSGRWLVVTDEVNTSLHSLPDLALHHQVRVEACRLPRAATDSLVYVPAWRYIAVLEITASGNITELRNITTVGGQDLWYPRVAVGPQPGQLCVAQFHQPRLWIVNTTNDRVIHTVRLPDPCLRLWSVAALDSGQLMIAYSVSYPNQTLAFYTSVADSPEVVHRSVADGVNGLLGHGQHFLAPYILKADLLVLGSNGSVLHTVDTVSGKLGVYLHRIVDVAVWQDCVWLGGYWGDLVLLCAV